MTTTRPPLGDKKELKPRITVIGIGGAGGNAVNNMIRGELQGVKFVTTNTDAQALSLSLADTKIQLGLEATQGLGAGSHPEVGQASAEESIEDVLGHLEGSNMLFVTAGMGGGTGTGATPVIARAAREKGILTIGVVTKPFHFEGSKRMKTADRGIEELQQYVDTLIIIPNQNLFRVANEKTTFADAFKMADDVLYSGVRSVTDLMMKPGLINLDFADVRAIMGDMMGKAMMGTGEAQGEGRAIEAAEAAISSPLLDDVSMKGARAVLINITGGLDMTLYEVDEAANRIRDEVDSEAHIIFGSTFDESLEGRIRVSCVATGIDAQAENLLKKDRVSELEKEREMATIHFDEEAETGDSGVYDDTETLIVDLKEDEDSIVHFQSVESTSTFPENEFEETYRHGAANTEREDHHSTSLSLFDRLMGRKSKPTSRGRESISRESSPRVTQPKVDPKENPQEEDERIEIPAFLRRKQNNS